MLFILFGSTMEMGKQSREFFVNHGFELIPKYNYVPDDFALKERFGEKAEEFKQIAEEKTEDLRNKAADGLEKAAKKLR